MRLREILGNGKCTAMKRLGFRTWAVLDLKGRKRIGNLFANIKARF